MMSACQAASGKRFRGLGLAKLANFAKFCIFFANFWRARSRLYQNEILQENMRLTTFFKLYKMCALLHRSKLNVLAKKIFENVVAAREDAEQDRVVEFTLEG